MIDEDYGELYLEAGEYQNFDFPGEEYFFDYSEPESSEIYDEVPPLRKESSAGRGSSGGSHVEFKVPPTSKTKLSSEDDQSPSSSYEAKHRAIKIVSGTSQDRRQSIFVHSSPSQFPDILKARKSAFGSIFIRASVVRGDSLDRKIFDSTLSVDPHAVTSPEKISGTSSDSGKKLLSLGLKESIFRAFEKRGIPKEPSTSSSSQWDVYPITESALFSVQVRDQIHQTRHISRIEERILTGTQQFLRFAHRWPTGSTWTGHWDSLGMAGNGTYIMPHNVMYHGKMHDGMFHEDNATLRYPNGFTCVHCKYEFGLLQSCQCRFDDSLLHEDENWGYCQGPDRRFIEEIQSGLKPGKTAQITADDPPRSIPNGCYDTSDGFFNPKTKILLSPDGDLLRVPTKSEEDWIVQNCRKGFEDFVGFRPDLYGNWYNYDDELIEEIAKKRRSYELGHITHDDLQVFYADQGLLPEHDPYRKTRTTSEMAFEEYLKSCPDPKRLVRRSREKQEHKLPEEIIKSVMGDVSYRSISKASLSSKLKSKSLMIGKVEGPSNERKISVTKNGKATEKSVSKINFKLKEQKDDDEDEDEDEMPVSKSKSYLRIVGSGKVDSKSILKHRSIDVETLTDSKKEEPKLDLNMSERAKNRAAWSEPVPNLPFGPRDDKEKCLDVLKELYESIPEEEEYCDSDTKKTCHFKKLSEDKFDSLKYWGKRMFMLNFEEENGH